MPFVSITLDVGAAMNACKFIWNNPERFKNVAILFSQRDEIQVAYVHDRRVQSSGFGLGLCTFLQIGFLRIVPIQKFGQEKYICSLLTTSESVKGSLVFSFGFPKPETL